MTLNHTTPPDEWQCTREEGHTGPCSFKPRDSQTPESADSKLADAIYGICLFQTYENDPQKTARNQTASIMLEIKKDRKTLLLKLHRTDGEGLPKRDYDNVTDEAIDAELEKLERQQLGKESK